MYCVYCSCVTIYVCSVICYYNIIIFSYYVYYFVM
uniref:Uncharacterized protein n=1 Tax=Siphoviridae sp. ctr2f5 TaxID=2825684 RepID=A0A8S5QDL4_9CAUD|nr:MAG TPA: hypothetical protein [Siphoviridae sp. ctr2f5]